MNSKSMESFQREAVNPAFVKMYLKVTPAMSILDILCKLLLRIFTMSTKQNNEEVFGNVICQVSCFRLYIC